MPRTKLEASLSHKKKRKGILVPLLEDLLTKPLDIDGPEDAEFIHQLVLKQTEREEERKKNYFYGPSSLASCVRQVYLKRNHKKHGLVPIGVRRVDTHFYFLTGNWLHFKWQFALYKLTGLPVDHFEVPVQSKHGDHGGTIDFIGPIENEWTVVDFKGLNVRDFQRAVGGKINQQYQVQAADYMMLANSSQRFAANISKALIVVENKGGPDKDHPIALTEVEVYLEDHLKAVQSRLKELRAHEEEGSVPKPECVSTTTYTFVSCPFKKFCRKEVKEIEQRQRKIASKDTARFKVAVPKSTDRSRRVTKR